MKNRYELQPYQLRMVIEALSLTADRLYEAGRPNEFVDELLADYEDELARTLANLPRED